MAYYLNSAAILCLCLVQSARAQQVSVVTREAPEARLERLEKMAADQAQRIEKLEVGVQRVAVRAPDEVRVAEVRKVVAELMADTSFRESLYPAGTTSVGYAPMRGFYIDTADEAFSLTVKGALILRYNGINRQTDNRNMVGKQKQDDVNAFEVESLYLAFFGHIQSKRVKYWIAVDGGYATLEDGQWRTFYATIDFEYVPEQYITAGLMRLPFGSQAMTFDPLLQMADRSLATYAFAPDRSIGVMAHGNLLKRRMTYFAAITNGVLNSGDSPSNDQLDTNFAYLARVCAYALGQGDSLIESRFGYNESDIGYSKDPLLRFGTSFLFNDNNGDAGVGGPPGLWAAVPDKIRSGRGIGGSEMIDDIGTQIWTVGADATFKYRGLSVNAEYFLRGVDGESEWSQWELMTGSSGSVHQQGGYVQVGYFIVPHKFEVTGRLGGVWDNGGDNTWEYAVGCNYYPFGSYNFRVAADFVRIDEVVGGASFSPNYSLNDEINMIRVVLQVGF